MRYDIVWYYAPHGSGHDGTRRSGYSWHSALPTPSVDEQVAAIERMGYRAVPGKRSIGPPEGAPSSVPCGDHVPEWSGHPGRMIHLVVDPEPNPTEPCCHCDGSGVDREALPREFDCLGCDGSGRMPEGYARARAYVMELLRDGSLTPHQVERAWALADGFGAGADHGGDWSHVRDSTSAAWLAMETYLRGVRGEHVVSVEVGRFSWDPATDTVSGPAEYMRERGSARLRGIESGADVVFNHGVSDPDQDLIATVLVSLQTDFAAWLGNKTMVRQFIGNTLPESA